MPSQDRQPLGPISPNRRSTSVGDKSVALGLVDRAIIPSFARFCSERTAYTSPFEQWYSYSDYYAQDEWLDGQWCMYMTMSGGRDLSVNEYLAEVTAMPLSAKSLTSDFQFDGMEDYDNHAPSTVSWSVMLSLIRGTLVDYAAFFRAEGLILRVMFTVPDHSVRVVVFKLWLTLVGRMVGRKAVEECSHGLPNLESLSTFDQCPNGAGYGVLPGWLRPAVLQHKSAQCWIYTAKAILDVRDRYFGFWGFNPDICVSHGPNCPNFYEEYPDDDEDYQSTRENTPRDDDEYELILMAEHHELQ